MPTRGKYQRHVVVHMTQEMHSNLRRLSGNERHINRLIRTAIREHLDRQGELAGSRRYFTGQFKERVERLEQYIDRQVLGYLRLLIFLVAHVGSLLILNALEVPENDRSRFSVSGLLGHAEEQMAAQGWRLEQRVADAIARSDTNAQTQTLDDGGSGEELG